MSPQERKNEAGGEKRKVAKLLESQKKEITDSLEARGVNRPCPRCGNTSFVVLDGYFNDTLQDDLKNMKIGGPSVPSIGVACKNCGFITQHALGVLNLLK